MMGVGIASVLVGISDMVLHLDASFFQEQTLKSLVYTAPFAAPLSYAGIGLLLILNRLEPANSESWGHWIVFLAMAGFVGNFALSVCDHAQNGFFVATEWIPVAAAAFAVTFLLMAIVRRANGSYLVICQAVMFAQLVVGGLGFYMHLTSTLSGAAESIAERVIFGAPIFAPLLFADLALLAMVGLWEMSASQQVSCDLG